MALYKTALDIALRNSRLFSAFAPKIRESWFGRLKETPAFSVFETASNLNKEQWTNLRTEMLESKSTLKTPSLDVTIMQLCIALKNLGLGKSYLKYLEENKYELNTAFIGKYFQLFYNCRDVLTDDDRKVILKMYDDLRLRHPLLDALTAESCILGLSITERWKDTEELLEMIKISCTASSASYSAIIASSFDNGEPETGWKYFNEMAKLSKVPVTEAYAAYFNYCSKNFKDPDICVEEIGKLFHFMADHDLLPNEIVMEEVKKTFKTIGWVGSYTKLSNAGVCQNCKEKLAPLKLSKDDFSHLSKSVLEKALVGSDIYFKSSPFELKKFMNFVNKTKPYNVVVDGLNVAYKNKHRTNTNSAKQLASVVRYFLDKNQIVLVLGRKHMLRWDQQSMNFIKNNSFLFLTDNLSADDPCLLYATLASGSETNFVSSDLMRQHKFILGDIPLKRLFKRWQMSHQCFFSFVRDKLFMTPPLNFLPVAQRGENCWHVPYRPSEATFAESYEAPSEWLCLKRPKSRSK